MSDVWKIGRVHFSMSAIAILLFAPVSLLWRVSSLTYLPIPDDFNGSMTSSTSMRSSAFRSASRTVNETSEPSGRGRSHLAKVESIEQSMSVGWYCFS